MRLSIKSLVNRYEANKTHQSSKIIEGIRNEFTYGVTWVYQRIIKVKYERLSKDSVFNPQAQTNIQTNKVTQSGVINSQSVRGCNARKPNHQVNIYVLHVFFIMAVAQTNIKQTKLGCIHTPLQTNHNNSSSR